MISDRKARDDRHRITIKASNDDVAIIVPRDQLQALRIALQPCQCGHIKSNGTAKTRGFFVKLLGLAVFLKPGSVQHVNTEELEG